MIVTLIEQPGTGDFIVFGTDGKRAGILCREMAGAWGAEPSNGSPYRVEPTMAAAIEVLTGHCPAGGVAIK